MNVTYNNKPAIMRRNGQVVLGDVGGLIFKFIAIDLDGNELGVTETIKVETVSTETTTEVQATFVAKLATPQNVTANGTTVSWDAVENATSYDVYADDTVLLGSAASQSSVDLTTLSGWADLTDGNHIIKIVAKADGYQDSEKSAGVEVTKAPQAYPDCLTFTGKDSEFTLKATNKTWDGTLEWSTDHNTWTVLAGTEEMQSVNRKLYLRGKGNTTFCDTSLSQGVQWVLSNKASCSGNIQTLLDWENPPASISTEHCYSDMFNGCTSLTSAPELPATTLAPTCYSGMFNGCTSLTSAPELSATTLAMACYSGMFQDCTSLTSVPQLPATTLSPTCYRNMFNGCSKLKVNTTSGNKIFTCPTTIPMLAVADMFTNTGGTFTGTPTAGETYYTE